MEASKRKKISKGVFWILLHKFVSKGDGNKIRGERRKPTTNCHLVEAWEFSRVWFQGERNDGLSPWDESLREA